jgi:hypothetical protein
VPVSSCFQHIANRGRWSQGCGGHGESFDGGVFTGREGIHEIVRGEGAEVVPGGVGDQQRAASGGGETGRDRA